MFLCAEANYLLWKRCLKELNQGENVVKKLVKEFENSGRNITCDNFFTSLALARYLLTKKLTIVRTIRKNKLELPISFTNAKGRTVFSSQFGFQKDAYIVSYCPKRGKLLLY